MTSAAFQLYPLNRASLPFVVVPQRCHYPQEVGAKIVKFRRNVKTYISTKLFEISENSSWIGYLYPGDT